MTAYDSRLTILVTGRVQGVFMRRGIKAIADKLGLAGEVGNSRDGRVQIVAEGKRRKLEKLLDRCFKGTRLSKVESLKFHWSRPDSRFKDFTIVRSGNYLEDKLSALKNLSGAVLSKETLPGHVAIIPDGNRRWAKERGLPTLRGHERGLNNFTELLDEAARLKIRYLTAWGFSTENWRRSQAEVDYLMRLLRRTIDHFTEKFLKEKISFRHFGRRDRLPQEISRRILELEDKTRDFHEHHFGLALDYGGRDEIIRAAEKCKMENGKVTEENFEKCLDTTGFPDPDLIIRTGGERRLSGLFPWQGTYAELYFAREFFPDFGPLQLRAAIADFSRRQRNFGV